MIECSITLGVVADTHVPDRVTGLHPKLLPLFRDAGVELIVHAGDISSAGVLRQLETVAPVIAAGGNRDWMISGLPLVTSFERCGITISLSHGHGGWLRYWLDKFLSLLQGYRFERYLPNVLRSHPQAGVYIFGHTHRSLIHWHHDRLLFNPGAAGTDNRWLGNPSAGLLRMNGDGKIEAEVVPLTGYRLMRRQWTALNGGEGN